MVDKIIVDEQEILVADLEPKIRAIVDIYQFTSIKLNELASMEKILSESKTRSLKNLKTEILSQKSGLLDLED
jgi:hypothetical protein